MTYHFSPLTCEVGNLCLGTVAPYAKIFSCCCIQSIYRGKKFPIRTAVPRTEFKLPYSTRYMNIRLITSLLWVCDCHWINLPCHCIMHSINCYTMSLELIHLWQSGTQASLNLIIVLFSLKINVMSYVKRVPGLIDFFLLFWMQQSPYIHFCINFGRIPSGSKLLKWHDMLNTTRIYWIASYHYTKQLYTDGHMIRAFSNPLCWTQPWRYQSYCSFIYHQQQSGDWSGFRLLVPLLLHQE